MRRCAQGHWLESICDRRQQQHGGRDGPHVAGEETIGHFAEVYSLRASSAIFPSPRVVALLFLASSNSYQTCTGRQVSPRRRHCRH